MTSDINVAPGQLWLWDFSVAEGWWPLDIVTEARRIGYDAQNTIIRRGDVFTVVTTNDPGPFEMMTVDEHGNWATQRWHVVIVHDKLVWMRHDDFRVAKLLKDV